MGDASFVAGDWGTSHLRLFLCDAEGIALDTGSGPGAAEVGGRFADIFESLTARWEESHGVLPAVLCGMVGSSIGWTQAPYIACPAMPEQIADGCVAPRDGNVHIVPGLSCRNRFNAPDFMRGEETQILGALKQEGALRQGRRVLCLPGTHTKWVVLQDGSVREFFTAPTGELFALLRDHSVLVRKPGRVEAAIEMGAFKEGLADFNSFPQAQLLHRLFECRSRQLSGELAAPNSAAYMSGLLVASDVYGALRVLSNSVIDRTVTLIGSSELTRLYAAALAIHSYEAHRVDGGTASLAGLVQVHQHLTQQVAAHDR
jgi:2-dehydro-3-deoxygalactonokinase